MTRQQRRQALQQEWQESSALEGVRREYTVADVVRSGGSLIEEHSMAVLGADRLWRLN